MAARSRCSFQLRLGRRRAHRQRSALTVIWEFDETNGQLLEGINMQLRSSIPPMAQRRFNLIAYYPLLYTKPFRRSYRVLNPPVPFLAACAFCTSVTKSFIFQGGTLFSYISSNSAGFRLATSGRRNMVKIQTMVPKLRKMKAVL